MPAAGGAAPVPREPLKSAGPGIVPEVGPTAADFTATSEYVRRRIDVPGFHASLWTGTHDAVVAQFCADRAQQGLFASVVVSAEGKALRLLPDAATFAAEDTRHVTFFLRTAGAGITAETVGRRVEYGTLEGQALHSLRRRMMGVFGPSVLANASLQERARRELSGHFHRFMAKLTEASGQAQGRTVLYLPPGEITDAGAAAGDRCLVQQLEAVVIHWTRQVKEMVSSRCGASASEGAGPLEEIAYWRGRAVNLSGIDAQLAREDVRNVLLVLELAGSSYLGPFQALSQRIAGGSAEAEDNLRFLAALVAPCEALATAEPAAIPGILPELLNRVRVVWHLSSFYNTEQRLTGLLRKVSNEIIRRCRSRIALEHIFEGNVGEGVAPLEKSIACGVAWKRTFERTAQAVRLHTEDERRRWDFDVASVFAQVEAFVQRCRELLEVCASRMQFARRPGSAGSAAGAPPELGGARGNELAKALRDIEVRFEAQIDRLRRLDYDILDVRVGRWHDDIEGFKAAAEDLDVRYANAINASLDGTSRVKDCVRLLEAFADVAKRDAAVLTVEKKTAEVYVLFRTQVEATRLRFDGDKGAPPLRMSEPQFAGSALWAHSLGLLVEEGWSALSRSRLRRSGREAEDAEAAFQSFVAVLRDFKESRFEAWLERVRDWDQATLKEKLDRHLMRRAGPEDESAASAARAEARVPADMPAGGFLLCNFDEELLSLFAEVQHWEAFNGEFTVPYVAHDICNQREKLRIAREHVMLLVQAYNDVLGDLTAKERRLFSDHIRRLDRRINQGTSKLTWASRGISEVYVRDCRKHCRALHDMVRHFRAARTGAPRSGAPMVPSSGSSRATPPR